MAIKLSAAKQELPSTDGASSGIATPQQAILRGPLEFVRRSFREPIPPVRYQIPGSSEAVRELQPIHERERELCEQILGIKDRVLTLKIHLIARLLWNKELSKQRESKVDKPQSEETDQPKEKSPFEKVTGLKWAKPNEPDFQTEGIAAVRSFNMVVQERYRIPDLDRISPWQIKILGQLAYQANSNDPPPAQLCEELERLLDKVNSFRSAVDEKLEPHLLSATRDLVAIRRESWFEYRELLKEIGDILERQNWFSPTYKSSGTGEKGYAQPSKPMGCDYQRWDMQELTDAQRLLGPALHRLKDRKENNSLLFGSGIQAFDAMLTVITNDHKHKPQKILTFPNIYFECDARLSEVCERHGIELKQINCRSPKALIKTILKEKPTAIFTGAIGLNPALDVNPVYSLLQSLVSDDFQKSWSKGQQMLGDKPIRVIIDNSASSGLAQWQDRAFRKNASDLNLKIAIIDSLAKYSTDGTDVTGGGLLTLIGDSISHRVRSSQGMMPTMSQVLRLGLAIDPDKLEEKMQRHSRNALALASTIESAIEGKKGLISGVSYPFLPRHPHHKLALTELKGGGGIVTLRLDEQLLVHATAELGPKIAPHHRAAHMQEVAAAFQSTINMLARAAGVELNNGTSYGLNTTRVAVYQDQWTAAEIEQLLGGSPGKGRPYLRIAVGTEDLHSVQLISQVILRANEIFAALRSRNAAVHFAENLVGRWPEGSSLTISGQTYSKL